MSPELLHNSLAVFLPSVLSNIAANMICSALLSQAQNSFQS